MEGNIKLSVKQSTYFEGKGTLATSGTSAAVTTLVAFDTVCATTLPPTPIFAVWKHKRWPQGNFHWESTLILPNYMILEEKQHVVDTASTSTWQAHGTAWKLGAG